MSVDYDLVCVICVDLVVDAHQTTCCGSLFCKSCISSWVNRVSVSGRAQLCPTCRTQLTSSMIVVDVRSDRKSAEHIRYCPFHAEFGCAFAGNRREVSSHQETCTYKPVTSRESITSEAFHFLVVDDSVLLCKMMKKLLQRAGHSAETAHDGAVALGMIEASVQRDGRPYDAIIMDINMPVLDGLDATRRLRELEAAAAASVAAAAAVGNAGSGTDGPVHVPYSRRQLVIAVTSNADEFAAAYQAGMNAFLNKPMGLESFMDTFLSLRTRAGTTSGSTYQHR
jgi:CheY-like chemotaxis protein